MRWFAIFLVIQILMSENFWNFQNIFKRYFLFFVTITVLYVISSEYHDY
jgi:hypothetical protein